MERVLYSKFSDDRKRKYCIRTDIIESDSVKTVKKIPLYEEGIGHISHLKDIYESLSQQYKKGMFVFNKCDVKNNIAYLEFLNKKSLQTLIEEYIDEDNATGIEELLYQYMKAIEEKCEKRKFVKSEEFIKVFGDVVFDKEYESLQITNIDLIFSNILVGNKWEVIDYEWTFAFPIPIQYVIYRAFFLAHHQMRQCEILGLNNLMRMANISEVEQKVFQEMERNFQKYITGDKVPFRDVLLSTGKERMTMGQAFQKRDQEIINRDNRILELIELNQKESQKVIKAQQELQKKDEQILHMISTIEAIESTKWWKLRKVLLKLLQK